LITSSTGPIARELVSLLMSHRYLTVRCGNKDTKNDAINLMKEFCVDPHRVEIVEFDPIDHPDSVAKAMDGVTRVYLLCPTDSFASMKWQEAIVSAAVASKSVRYIVKQSSVGADPESDDAVGVFTKVHGQGEELVKKCGLAYTIVRSGLEMQRFLDYPVYSRSATVFYFPTGDAILDLVDSRDIAATVFSLLVMKYEDVNDYVGETLDVFGAVSVTAKQIETTLSRVAGKAIAHNDSEDALARAVKSLSPAVAAASDFVQQDAHNPFTYQRARKGLFAKTKKEDELNSFLELVGRYQHTFSKFASDHADFFN